MLRQQSQAELFTQRQNNGNNTLVPRGTLVEQQVAAHLAREHADTNYGNILATQYAKRETHESTLRLLVKFPVQMMALAALIAGTWFTGAGLYYELSQPWWLAIGAALAVLLGAPFLLIWLHHTATNMKAQFTKRMRSAPIAVARQARGEALLSSMR